MQIHASALVCLRSIPVSFYCVRTNKVQSNLMAYFFRRSTDEFSKVDVSPRSDLTLACVFYQRHPITRSIFINISVINMYFDSWSINMDIHHIICSRKELRKIEKKNNWWSADDAVWWKRKQNTDSENHCGLFTSEAEVNRSEWHPILNIACAMCVQLVNSLEPSEQT